MRQKEYTIMKTWKKMKITASPPHTHNHIPHLSVHEQFLSNQGINTINHQDNKDKTTTKQNYIPPAEVQPNTINFLKISTAVNCIVPWSK